VTKGTSASARRCILEEAQRLFAARGYHGVSIRDIVQACGLSNAALYYYFGSKQNLYCEVLKGYIANVAQRLQDAERGDGTCRQRLSRAAYAYAQMLLESRTLIQTLFRDMAQFDPEKIQGLLPDAVGQVPSVIAAILEDGMAAGEIRAVDAHRVAVLVLGMVNSLTSQRLFIDVEDTPAGDIDLIVDVLFEGIGS
jgi:AcrR family transcriptional regulator